MRTEELEQYIAKVRKDYDTDSQDIFDKWVKELEDYESSKELLQHKIIVDFSKGIESEIKGIDEMLKTKREFNEDAEIDKRLRNYLFDKKELYTRFVSLLKVGNKVTKINEEIKKYVKN